MWMEHNPSLHLLMNMWVVSTFRINSTFFTDIHFEMKLSILAIKNIICHKLEIIVQINIAKSEQCY